MQQAVLLQRYTCLTLVRESWVFKASLVSEFCILMGTDIHVEEIFPGCSQTTNGLLSYATQYSISGSLLLRLHVHPMAIQDRTLNLLQHSRNLRLEPMPMMTALRVIPRVIVTLVVWHEVDVTTSDSPRYLGHTPSNLLNWPFWVESQDHKATCQAAKGECVARSIV